ncbi:hypothetical protein ACVWZZ_005711 [Bradyrhizobium sp. LM6.10]
MIIELGKFHGVVAPQTPIRGLIASSLASGRGERIVSARLFGVQLDIGATDIEFT